MATAGHPAPVAISAGEVRPLEVLPGPPLGVEPDPGGWRPTATALGPTWRLLLYTDGAVEVRTGRRSSDRLGEDGLLEWLRAHPDQVPAGELLDALVAHLQRLAEGPLDDDLAVVVLDAV